MYIGPKAERGDLFALEDRFFSVASIIALDSIQTHSIQVLRSRYRKRQVHAIYSKKDIAFGDCTRLLLCATDTLRQDDDSPRVLPFLSHSVRIRDGVECEAG